VEGVAKEFAGSALTIGKELLWDILPIRYCADTVDAFVFLGFIWQMVRTFND
jgi:hypothetical protein